MDSKNLIQVDSLSRIYELGDNIINALDNISLRIERGEFVSIMGPSGSGKSTFMNVIGCLDKPTRGTYCLEGIDVSKLARDELAKIRNEKIGFVFQGFNLLPRTSALENVELPLLYNGTTAKQRIEKALEALKVDEPTGNLDTKTSAEIMNLFVELNSVSHITIILVTHEQDIAAYARRLVKFLDGKIISDQHMDKR
jgi:putative ABC transport system ATP-binding protein